MELVALINFFVLMVIWLWRMMVMVIWMRLVVMAMAIFMTHQSFTLYREAIEAIAAE